MPAHSLGTKSAAATTGTGNPQTMSVNVAPGETILVIGIVVAGSTVRTGGAPTYAGRTMTQADSTRIAITTPETSTECWYLEDPPVGTANVSVPNNGAFSLNIVYATAVSSTGISKLNVANGATNTSTNPTASVTTTKPGCFIFSVVGNGAQLWAPSARDGTQINDQDLGAFGMGSQYILQANAGAQAAGWTFGTSEDWGLCVAAFEARDRAHSQEDYRGARADDGMSVTERIY